MHLHFYPTSGPTDNSLTSAPSMHWRRRAQEWSLGTVMQWYAETGCSDRCGMPACCWQLCTIYQKQVALLTFSYACQCFNTRILSQNGALQALVA